MARDSEEYPSLVAQAGPLSGQRWILTSDIMVGRDDSCQVVIHDRQVSRYHARLICLPTGIQLEDLGSKNGTHLNGHDVIESVMLQDGDVIQIAFAQQFLYLSSDSTLPLEISPLATHETILSPRMLRLDTRSRRVWIGSDELLPPLSVSQFQLLKLLYNNPGRVVSRTELIQAVWGKEDAVGISEQALDALVRRLRERLASVNSKQPFLITIRGHGLRLDNPPLK